jgi:hypothetical protein
LTALKMSSMGNQWKKDNMPWSLLDRLWYHKNCFLVRIAHGRDSAEYNNLILISLFRSASNGECFWAAHPFTRNSWEQPSL